MSAVTIEKLAAERGYWTVKAKEGENDYRLVTLRRGELTIAVDDELIADIASMACSTACGAAGRATSWGWSDGKRTRIQ